MSDIDTPSLKRSRTEVDATPRGSTNYIIVKVRSGDESDDPYRYRAPFDCKSAKCIRAALRVCIATEKASKFKYPELQRALSDGFLSVVDANEGYEGYKLKNNILYIAKHEGDNFDKDESSVDIEDGDDVLKFDFTSLVEERKLWQMQEFDPERDLTDEPTDMYQIVVIENFY